MTLSQQGAPYQGLHQQISIYIRRKTDNSLVTTQHPYGELIVTNAILVLPALKPKETIA